MKTRKFEVTQFHDLRLGAKWFVKLHGARFSKAELSAIQNLRQDLNRKFPQTKQTKLPGSWHLTIETVEDDFMAGRLSVITPTHQNLLWMQLGTVEYICETFQRMLKI